METDVTINTDLTPAEDFSFLRARGIELIQKLAGKVWTDYNSHDPGITLLEAICYALTDLGYRTSFNVEDLLTHTNDEAGLPPGFYSARQIFSSGVVTVLDFRKLIIDVEGVKNAWIEMSDDYEVALYLSNSSNEGQNFYELNYDETTGEPLRLKGLYKVVVEVEEGIAVERQDEVLHHVKAVIQVHRNLCEDVVTVNSVEYEPFTMEADVQVNEGADIEKINALIFQLVQNLFAPPIQFYTLDQMLNKGYTIEQVFEGPALKHGFIDADELIRSQRSPQVHLSDIINNILKIEGVIAIKSCAFPAGSQSSFSDFTEYINMDALPSEKIVRLDTENSIIRFSRKGDKHRDAKSTEPSRKRVAALYKFLQSQNRSTKLKGPQLDLVAPKGNWMNVADYYPFQNNLPACYGTSDPVIAESEGQRQFPFKKDHELHDTSLNNAIQQQIDYLPIRKKQVLQLKGYLMVFEQIMNDYLSQLEHLGDIFSFDGSIDRTYYSQSILNTVIDAALLIKDVSRYNTNIEKGGSRKIFLEKRGKILDHLLARFGEEMNSFSFYVHNSQTGRASDVIRAKTAFLSDYVQLGQEKIKSFNYTDRENAWDTLNVAGIKKRICRLLGIQDYSTRFTTADWIEVEKRQEANSPLRFVAVVRDPQNKNLLLESRAFETESEVRHIMNFMIQNGFYEQLYQLEDKKGQFSYQLQMENDEKQKETVASMQFATKTNRDESFSKLIELLRDFGQQENFHLLEHILLRPKIDPQSLKAPAQAPESTSVSLLSVLRKPQTPSPTKTEQVQFPYKFRIDRSSTKGSLSWTLSLMRDKRTAALVVEEEFPLKKGAIERMVAIRQAGADKVNYDESINADGYHVFVIKVKDRVLAKAKKAYKEKKEMDDEITSLIDFFSFQLNLMRTAANRDEVSETDLADPYSFQLSILIPAWPLRFREAGFKYLLEKAIYNELPSHIYPTIYWLDYKTMKDYENVYKAWLQELTTNEVPDISRVNSLLTVFNEIRKLD
ncbi:MAG TPA: hypothetical protein VF487_13360 [Chitinophagaceae bacterium]